MLSFQVMGQTNKVLFYTTKDISLQDLRRSDSEWVEIDLALFQSYTDLLNRVDTLKRLGRHPYILINGYNGTYKLVEFSSIDTRYDRGCLRKNQVIKIVDNKIKDEFVSGSLLTKTIKDNYYNDGVRSDLCDSPDMCLIGIIYEEENFRTLDHLINIITESYDALDLPTLLPIFLMNPLPPPPPPPISIDD